MFIGIWVSIINYSFRKEIIIDSVSISDNAR